MINSLKRRILFLALVIMVSTLLIGPKVYAVPQTAEFVYRNGFWYDSWGYTRNNAFGPSGFMPNLAYEALGKWREVAFSWGTQFAEMYPSKTERAEAVLRFVQRRTEYGYDEDNVEIGGIFQEEWAWNGDDMASQIDLNSNTPAIGDCEDLAFLCSAIYEGAGFDTAMVLAPEHAALLIWLPDYPEVLKWNIEGDGREYGWIWVESTGDNNPLGWTPNSYRDGNWEAFVIGFLYIHNIVFYPEEPSIEEDVVVTASILDKTSNLDEVTLRYFLKDRRYEVEMERVDTLSYQATIPKQEDGAIIEFEIEATNQMGYKRESDRLSYQVGEGGFNLPPFLFDAGLILVVIVVLIIMVSVL